MTGWRDKSGPGSEQTLHSGSVVDTVSGFGVSSGVSSLVSGSRISAYSWSIPPVTAGFVR